MRFYFFTRRYVDQYLKPDQWTTGKPDFELNELFNLCIPYLRVHSHQNSSKGRQSLLLHASLLKKPFLLFENRTHDFHTIYLPKAELIEEWGCKIVKDKDNLKKNVQYMLLILISIPVIFIWPLFRETLNKQGLYCRWSILLSFELIGLMQDMNWLIYLSGNSYQSYRTN